MADGPFKGATGEGNYQNNLGNPDGGGQLGNANNDFAYGGSNGYSDAASRAVANGADPSQEWDNEGVDVHKGPSGADIASGRYQGLGQQWANQQAPQLNLGQANGYMQFGNNDRNMQTDALTLQAQAARGLVPSVAAMQMQQGNADAMRQQLAMAGSARGAGAMGMAQYGAAQNAGNMQAQNIANTGMLRAQEMANARGAYMQGATGIRGQDLGAAQLAGDWAGQNANLQMQQHGLGLQGQLGFEGLGNDVQKAQLDANMQKQALAQGQWKQQTGLDQHSTDGYNPLTMISDARAKENAFKVGVATGIKAVDNPALPIAPSTAGRQYPAYYPTVQTSQQVAPGAGPVAPSTAGWQSPEHYPTMQVGPTAPLQPEVMATPPGVAQMQVTSDARAKTPSMPVQDDDGGDRFYKGASATLGMMRGGIMGQSFAYSDARAKSDAYLAGAADAMRKDLGYKFGAPSAVTRGQQGGVVSIPEVDLSDAPASPLDAAHDAIPAHTFSYKPGVPGTNPGVPQAGIMAQQAQAHPLTAAMVREDPQTGLKALDIPTATSFTLAASSDHNKRIRALERAADSLNQDFGYAGKKADVINAAGGPADYGPMRYGGEIYRLPDGGGDFDPRRDADPAALAYGGQ